MKKQNLRYINLIIYQNELIAKFLGYDNRTSAAIRIMCSEAKELFSNSIEFSKKLKYALDYLYNNDMIEYKIYNKYNFYRSLYHSKLNLFQIKKIKTNFFN